MSNLGTLESWRPLAAVATLAFAIGGAAAMGAQVQVEQGELAGTKSADGKIQVFKGIPFAAPPVGALRWQAPQPPAGWQGVRQATEFGPRCMQARIFQDMIFRDSGPSEDCLYLNVWTPDVSASARLPVMVWIYGGGFTAGAASEPRQDGENLARHGVVVVNLNYRLGVFGFFAHPELAKESGHNAAGNYGLMDQAAALAWVKKNIAVFGGDPSKVTIFGESAGSFSVSALMASPLSEDLFARAIGESGAFFGATLGSKTLAESEAAGKKFASTIGASSLEALRAKPAAELLTAATQYRAARFSPNTDGYFLPEEVSAIFAAGKQSHVPLLAGWNADEGSYRSIFGSDPPTLQNYIAHVHKLYGENADAVLKVYSASNDEEAKRAAGDLAGDQFIGYSTWRWLQAQNETGKSPVYRYRFEDAPPVAAEDHDPAAGSRGAYHSSEIEFVFGALASKKLPWRPQDEKLSEMMQTYWSNFAKTGNPNGSQLPKWPVYSKATEYQVMHLKAEPAASPEQHRARYELLESLSKQKQPATP